MEQLLW